MAFNSARLKIVRRLGPLPGLTRKTLNSSPAAGPRPGNQRPRRKVSIHRRRLDEKQKLRFNYGVRERQMLRYVASARRQPGAIGENLLILLERRMDNVVFRLGIAPTIRAARQLIVHGHVTLNGRRHDRPSHLVHVGDVVELALTGARSLDHAAPEREPRLRLPSYLRRDVNESASGRIVSLPARNDVPFPVCEALVIAYYAR